MTEISERNLLLKRSGQTDSILKAARRSPGFNLRKSVRAFLMSRAVPLSEACLSASTAGSSGLQMKAKACAKRPMVSRSIRVSSICISIPLQVNAEKSKQRSPPSSTLWLALHDIRYEKLVMLPPEAGEADAANSVTGRKASLYRYRKAKLFVEATEADAAALADAARLPVYSAVTRRMIYPGCGGAVRYTARARDRLTWLSCDLFDRGSEKIRRLRQRDAPKAASSVLSG